MKAQNLSGGSSREVFPFVLKKVIPLLLVARMRKAAIDVGSQSILLLIAETGDGGSIQSVREEIFAPRLGEGLAGSGRLTRAAMQRAEADLNRALAVCSEECIERGDIIAAATAAVREASNGEDFVVSVRENLGLEVMVLSGLEEAELSYLGSLSGLDVGENDPIVVLDVGGGSSECIIGFGRCPCEAMSVPIGAVKLAEGYGRSPGTIEEALEELAAAIRGPAVAARGRSMIGVGGTITTLAAVKLGLDKYDAGAISGCCLTIGDLDGLIDKFRSLALEELKDLKGMEPSRADIIEAGATIFRQFMKEAGSEETRVSAGGLRYGLLAAK